MYGRGVCVVDSFVYTAIITANSGFSEPRFNENFYIARQSSIPIISKSLLSPFNIRKSRFYEDFVRLHKNSLNREYTVFNNMGLSVTLFHREELEISYFLREA